MDKKFSFLWSSAPLDYERLVLEISYCDEPIAEINLERGTDNPEIEFSALPPHQTGPRVPLGELLKALEHAKREIARSYPKDD